MTLSEIGSAVVRSCNSGYAMKWCLWGDPVQCRDYTAMGLCGCPFPPCLLTDTTM